MAINSSGYKICTKCKTSKKNSLFYKDKRKSSGLVSQCSDCLKEYQILYQRTKSGLISSIYRNQKKSSIRRGHPSPEYSLKELREWAYCQELFHILFNKWVSSNFNVWEIPSVDRIDDRKGYSISNIQLMSWKENSEKGWRDIRAGRNNKLVYQFSVEGDNVGKFKSLSLASKDTGVSIASISHCCTGRNKSAGGYVWRFA